MQHGELRRGEHRHQVHEMPVPEPSLGFRPDEQHPAVGIQVALFHQVRGDLRRVDGEGGQRQPFLPGPLPHPPLLQAEREELLRGDVPWRRRRGDRLDKPTRPGEQQPGRE
jgi:hypothetical protein